MSQTGLDPRPHPARGQGQVERPASQLASQLASQPSLRAHQPRRPLWHLCAQVCIHRGDEVQQCRLALHCVFFHAHSASRPDAHRSEASSGDVSDHRPVRKPRALQHLQGKAGFGCGTVQRGAVLTGACGACMWCMWCMWWMWSGVFCSALARAGPFCCALLRCYPRLVRLNAIGMQCCHNVKT